MSNYGNRKNNIHFYVARDKDNALWLYLGKPIREESNVFISNKLDSPLSNSIYFGDWGLDINNYKDLKWEDEPVEVFLNLDN